MTYYHGGKPGLAVGDVLVPSPPHVSDGCPICVARASGQSVTVAVFRAWLRGQGPNAAPILAQLADAPDDEVIDPPTPPDRVYFTTALDYAEWYAARSGNGDLYEVDPIGEAQASGEDHFTTFWARAARIRRVVKRRVFLTRQQRRALLKNWKKADKHFSGMETVPDQQREEDHEPTS